MTEIDNEINQLEEKKQISPAKTVIIIDDDAPISQEIIKMINEKGYKVLCMSVYNNSPQKRKQDQLDELFNVKNINQLELLGVDFKLPSDNEKISNKLVQQNHRQLQKQHEFKSKSKFGKMKR